MNLDHDPTIAAAPHRASATTRATRLMVTLARASVPYSSIYTAPSDYTATRVPKTQSVIIGKAQTGED
ncbi:hypothetical protein NPX13_g601 [Xylaria arbuscula]|uniref:Uncharacterized protein n=1 Tax=Xylaria arbuscula TaxID=114810 RepID=A0A9W8NNM8_9PEZI|nr:hypothetical protein NPX13_g601 [Xylaria arbuscula]